ncbi:Uncharacterised protein at_DN0187 [Pycnogonum litorale]
MADFVLVSSRRRKRISETGSRVNSVHREIDDADVNIDAKITSINSQIEVVSEKTNIISLVKYFKLIGSQVCSKLTRKGSIRSKRIIFLCFTCLIVDDHFTIMCCMLTGIDIH